MDSSSHYTSFLLKVNMKAPEWRKTMTNVSMKVKGVSFNIDSEEELARVSGYISPVVLLQNLANAVKILELIWVDSRYQDKNKPPVQGDNYWNNPHTPRFVLKVNMNAPEWHKAMIKVLAKVEGVSCNIDKEGKACVSGNIGPDILLSLKKAEKIAELIWVDSKYQDNNKPVLQGDGHNSSHYTTFLLKVNKKAPIWQKTMTNVLMKVEGVSYNIDTEEELAHVSGNISPVVLLQILAKAVEILELIRVDSRYQNNNKPLVQGDNYWNNPQAPRFVLKVNMKAPEWHETMIKVLAKVEGVSCKIDEEGSACVSGKIGADILQGMPKGKKIAELIWVNKPAVQGDGHNHHNYSNIYPYQQYYYAPWPVAYSSASDHPHAPSSLPDKSHDDQKEPLPVADKRRSQKPITSCLLRSIRAYISNLCVPPDVTLDDEI